MAAPVGRPPGAGGPRRLRGGLRHRAQGEESRATQVYDRRRELVEPDEIELGFAAALALVCEAYGDSTAGAAEPSQAKAQAGARHSSSPTPLPTDSTARGE